jgi:MFS family permease
MPLNKADEQSNAERPGSPPLLLIAISNLDLERRLIMTPWWTAQQAGLIGGIAGSAVGVLGGIAGTLAGILAPRGKARRFVMTLFVSMIALGIVALGVGIVAVIIGQPYAVWYPLVLLGGILTIVTASILPGLRIRYRQAEARRLEAAELRRT